MLWDCFVRLQQAEQLGAASDDAVRAAFAPYFEDVAQLNAFVPHAQAAIAGKKRLTFQRFQRWVKEYRLAILASEIDTFRTLDTGHEGHVPRVREGKDGQQVASASVGAASWLNSAKLFLAGCLAGAVSRTATAPGERLKVLRATGQLDGPLSTWRQVLGALVRKEGLATFWRGNIANVLKVAPAKGVKFVLMEKAIELVARDPKRPTTGETLTVSCCVAGASAALTHPLDTLKTMLAAGAQPAGMVALSRRIAREQGLAGFFVGLGPALVSNVPFIGVSWAAFNIGKRKYNEALGRDPLHKPGTAALLGLSCFATGAAEAVAYPLYLLKTLQQSEMLAADGAPAGTGGGAQGRPVVHSVLQLAKRTMHRYGPLGLYSGVSIAWAKSAPAACITYVTYETAKANL